MNHKNTRLYKYVGIVLALILLIGSYLYFYTPNSCNIDSGTVCSTNGLTYEDECAAKDAGAIVLNIGPCVEKFCEDSDSGKDITVKGITTNSLDSSTDDCTGSGRVIEYYCDKDQVTFEYISCPEDYICSDGACILSDISEEVTCEDSDGGLDYSSVGNVIYDEIVYTDSCSGDLLKEYYCTEEDEVDSISYTCPLDYHCSAGKCVKDSFTDSDDDGDGASDDDIDIGDVEEGDIIDEDIGDEDTEHLDTICEETDAGRFDYDTQGIADDGTSLRKDECLDDGRLREYYCDGGEDGTVDSDDVSCEPGYECSVGRCVEIGADPVTCSDRDGRYDYEVRGVTYLSDGSLNKTDKCVPLTDKLLEYYCDGDSIAYDRINCTDFGMICSAGVCIDEDSAPLPICSDTDGHLILSSVVGGTASLSDGSESFIDYCINETTVLEYTCLGDFTIIPLEMHCASDYRCEETITGGACIEQEPLTCEDSDGHLILGIFEGGTVTLSDSSDRETDYCINDTTVMEYSCFGDTLIIPSEFICPSGYSCQETETGGACIEDVVECEDSDGGNVPYTAGTVTDEDGSHKDRCSSATKLTEYYCVDGIRHSKGWNCASYGLVCDITSIGGSAACVESETPSKS